MNPSGASFGFNPTEVMLRCRGDVAADPVWERESFEGFHDISISPAAAVFGYALGVFDGLKARRAADGRLLVFRATDCARRLGRSAEKLLMPAYPTDALVEHFVELVRRNRDHVPAAGSGALYLRPMLHGTEPMLGGRPGRRFQLLVYASPVGSFFASDAGLKLRRVDQGRCPPGGTGDAKAIGNYASVLATVARWRSEGYDDVLFLDCRTTTHVTELSGANVFARLSNGDVVTPDLTDEILAGITRDSVMTLMRSRGSKVIERPLRIEEVLEDAVEVFCTGTAYTVRPVATIASGDRVVEFGSNELARDLLAELQGIQRGVSPDRYDWITEVTP